MKRKFYFLLAAIVLCSSGTFSQTSITTTSPVINEKYIELKDRVTLHYVEQGDPNGIPVILLHGYTDSWHSYELVLSYLPKNMHVYAITQRGHGGSGRPHYGYAPEHFANDVAAFMKNLHIEQAVIVGHSMGATIAQCFAVQYPAMTRGIVLAGSFANWQLNPARADFSKVVESLENPIDPEFARGFQQSTVVRKVPPVFFETMVEETTKVPARIWKAIAKEMVTADFTQELEAITIPALLIWGDQDNISIRTDQDVLLASIEDSRLIVYKGAGHAVQWEEPQRFADDIVKFIQEADKKKSK